MDTLKKPFRAAIIGFGRGGEGRGGAHSIGYAHAWCYRDHPRTTLAAAANRSPEHARAFAAEFPGCTMYDDYRRMIEVERPEFVSVCAFPQDREEMVAAALECGARVLWIEKPLAVSAGAIRRMLDRARAKGARLYVNHQRRFGQPMERMREVIAGGGIGDLVSLDIRQPGNALLDFGSHLLDLACWMMPAGSPTRVIAAGDYSQPASYKGLPVEQHIVASIAYDNGARITVETGKEPAGRVPILRAQGADGFAELHVSPPQGAPGILRARLAGQAHLFAPSFSEHFHHGEDHLLYYRRALDEIVATIESGGPSRIDASQAARGAELLIAIYAAARLGRALSLPLGDEETPFASSVLPD
jgi:predicted dehydrogenase